MRSTDADSEVQPAREIALFGWWYLCLALPTIVLKYRYLSTVHYGDFAGIVLGRADRPDNVPAPIYVSLWFARDVLASLLVVAVGYALTKAWPSLRTAIVVGIIAGAFLIGGLNELSLGQTNTLLSLENLRIAWHWTSDNPDILRSFLALSSVQFVLIGIACVTLPLVMRRLSTDTPLAQGLRYVPLVIAGTMVAIAVADEVLRPACRQCSLGDSYWGQSLAALSGPGWAVSAGGASQNPESLSHDFRALVYPGKVAPDSLARIVHVPEDRKKRRHILVVVLETAPRNRYDFLHDTSLAAIQRMSRQAIVSDHHYTAAPLTSLAIYTILSGTYPSPGRQHARVGHLQSGALGSVLRNHGFETRYIDSYRLDWLPGQTNNAMVRSLGFEDVVELTSRAASGKDGLGPAGSHRSFEDALRVEEAGFGAAMDVIRRAQSRNRHALAVFATNMGHWPWKAPLGQEATRGPERIRAIARALDGALGRLVSRLDDAGLLSETIIVVTGDHGLRFREEFRTLDEIWEHGGAEFNVPFLLYAPGIFSEQIRLPYVTSHVDIAPTLLELSGLPQDGLLYHGESMLSTRLSERVTFQMDYGLTPIDGLHYKGCFAKYNTMSGDEQLGDCPGGLLAPGVVPQLLKDGRRLMEASAAVSPEPPNASPALEHR